MSKCKFCVEEGEWNCIIRSTQFEAKDGSDILVCNDCLNLYAAEEWEALTKRIEDKVAEAFGK